MSAAVEVRPYRATDFAALAELVDALAAPRRSMTPAGLRSFLSDPGHRPETDLVVAPAPDGGRLLGARDVRVTARGDEEVLIIESWGGVRSEVGGGDLTGALLGAAAERARRLLAERGRARGIVQARCRDDDAATRAAFEAFGFGLARHLVTMLRPDLDDLEEPRLPAGVELRAYRRGRDEAAWVAAFNEAFADHWGGFIGTSPERWRHQTDGAGFKPEVSLVAWDGSELAGFCHCRIDDDLNALDGRRVGVIRYVGVRPRWRGGGLGGALTRAGLRALRDAGMEAVALGVDAENVTGARRLYERHGFAVVGREVVYRGEVTATPLAAPRSIPDRQARSSA